MKKSFAIGLISVLTLGIMAGAGAEPVKLEFKFSKDQVTRYVTKVEINLQLPEMTGVPKGPLSMTMSAQQAQKVMAVYPDGTARIKIWTGDIKLTGKGFPTPKEKIPDSTSYMKMSKLGAVLAMEMPQMPASKKTDKKGVQAMPTIPGFDMSKIINMLGDLSAFPTDPIEVGSTWSKPIPMPENLGTVELNNTLKSAAEEFAGAKAAKVTQTLDCNIDLSQAAKMILKAFGGETSSMPMPDFKGNLNAFFTGDLYFSTELGEVLGRVGSGKLTVNVVLPPEAVKEGAPPEINAAAEISVSMTKI